MITVDKSTIVPQYWKFSGAPKFKRLVCLVDWFIHFIQSPVHSFKYFSGSGDGIDPVILGLRQIPVHLFDCTSAALGNAPFVFRELLHSRPLLGKLLSFQRRSSSRFGQLGRHMTTQPRSICFGHRLLKLIPISLVNQQKLTSNSLMSYLREEEGRGEDVRSKDDEPTPGLLSILAGTADARDSESFASKQPQAAIGVRGTFTAQNTPEVVAAEVSGKEDKRTGGARQLRSGRTQLPQRFKIVSSPKRDCQPRSKGCSAFSRVAPRNTPTVDQMLMMVGIGRK